MMLQFTHCCSYTRALVYNGTKYTQTRSHTSIAGSRTQYIPIYKHKLHTNKTNHLKVNSREAHHEPTHTHTPARPSPLPSKYSHDRSRRNPQKNEAGYVKTKNRIGQLKQTWVKDWVDHKPEKLGERPIKPSQGAYGLGFTKLRHGEVEHHFKELKQRPGSGVGTAAADLYSHNLGDNIGTGIVIDIDTQRLLDGKKLTAEDTQTADADRERKIHLQLERDENYYWGKKFANSAEHDSFHDDMAFTKLMEHFKNKNYTPSLPLYNTLLAGLGKRGNLRRAIFVYRHMLNYHSIKPDSRTYTALFQAMSIFKGIHLTEALEMEDEMRRRGVKPTVQTYNALLAAIRKSKHPQAAHAAFERMKQDMVEPDVITYTELLDVCMRADGVGAAMSLIAQLKQEGVQQDIQLYNVFFRLCRDSPRDQDRAEAITIFRELCDVSDESLLPTIHTFDIMLGVYTKAGHSELDLLKLIGRQGVEMDSGFESSLLSLYSNKKDREACWNLYRKIQANDHPPSPPNITAMLQIAKGDNLYALIEDARTTLKGAPATGKDRMANEMLKAIYQNGRSSERLFEGIRCMIELGIEFRFYHLNGIAMFIKHNDRKARPDHDFIPNLIAVMKEAPPTELVDKKIANWQLTHKRALSRDRAENEAIRKANALAEANMKARDRFVEKTARVSTSVLPDASASEGQDSRAGVSEGVEGTTRPKRSREVKVIHWEI